MNPNQQTFLREYLRTGDKIAAYQTAYPKAKESSLKNAANRLLQHPEIAATLQQETEAADMQAKEQFTQRRFDRMMALHILAGMAIGEETREKVWHTSNGFRTLDIKPTIAQSLSAIRQYALMEGWYAPRQSAPKPRKDEQPKEKINYDVYISGLPMAEYGKLFDYTADAYYDKEDGTCIIHLTDTNARGKFLEIQKARNERKDKERDARMTPALQREEQWQLKELEKRPVDESLYQQQDKLIEQLQKHYLDTKDENVLKECRAVQQLCGLRYLHHRHRYETEQTSGYQFHPLNNNLVRRVAPGTYRSLPLRGGASASPVQQRGGSDETPLLPPNRQQTTTLEGNPKSEIPNPNQVNSHHGCHPERSEGSPDVTGAASSKQHNPTDSLLRASHKATGSAQNDKQERKLNPPAPPKTTGDRPYRLYTEKSKRFGGD